MRSRNCARVVFCARASSRSVTPSVTSFCSLLVHELRHRGRRVTGLRRHDDLETAVEPLAVVERAHVLRDLHVVHESLVQARVLVAREHVRERDRAPRRPRGRPSPCATRSRAAAAAPCPRAPGTCRAGQARDGDPRTRRHRRAARNVAEVLLNAASSPSRGWKSPTIESVALFGA